jgi:hypothetical protein
MFDTEMKPSEQEPASIFKLIDQLENIADKLMTG